MSLEKPTLVDAILDELYNLAEMLPRPLETPYSWSRRLKHFDPLKYRRAVKDLQAQGLVKVFTKNEKTFIELTEKGSLRTLLNKARLAEPKKSDGKWRLIMFDIPESSKGQRRLFRTLLLQNGFKKLQASVYVSPYPLNSAALTYLKQVGLMNYIRIFRVDGADDDKALKNMFNIK